jgi:hypothetical protein
MTDDLARRRSVPRIRRARVARSGQYALARDNRCRNPRRCPAGSARSKVRVLVRDVRRELSGSDDAAHSVGHRGIVEPVRG